MQRQPLQTGELQDEFYFDRFLTLGARRSVPAYFPPTLLHNLQPASDDSLTLTPTRFSSPFFPTAHSVTVARVASPHSVNRACQTLFLDGLKQYFQSRRRVLKRGDLIAVGICEDTARFSEAKSEEDEVE